MNEYSNSVEEYSSYLVGVRVRVRVRIRVGVRVRVRVRSTRRA